MLMACLTSMKATYGTQAKKDKALSRHQGIEENIATKQLFQRMSLTLMRGNAAMIMSRRPDSDLAQPEVDGIQ